MSLFPGGEISTTTPTFGKWSIAQALQKMATIAPYWTRKPVTYTYTTTTGNASLNITSLPYYVAGNSDITIIVNAGVYLWSNSISIAGLTLTGGTTGDVLTIINNGNIIGCGGTGGGYPGGAGGMALSLGYNTIVSNTTTGYIGGGGGGGISEYGNATRGQNNTTPGTRGVVNAVGGGGGAGGGLGGGGAVAGPAPGVRGNMGTGIQGSSGGRIIPGSQSGTVGSITLINPVARSNCYGSWTAYTRIAVAGTSGDAAGTGGVYVGNTDTDTADTSLIGSLGGVGETNINVIQTEPARGTLPPSGGGSWGQTGPTRQMILNAGSNCYSSWAAGSSYALGGAGGRAVALNGNTVTWVHQTTSNNTTTAILRRVYGSVS